MLAWIKRGPGLTKPVDNIGIWWAVFGPGGVLSVIMGWAASFFTPIAQYGWGAVVFAGVGAACVIMFAVSALLIAYRYFRPLTPQAQSDAVNTPNQPSEAVTQEIQEIREKISDLTKTMVNLAKESDASLSKLERKLEDEIFKSDAKISKYISETTTTIDSMLLSQNDRTLKILGHLKAQYELNEILRLRPKIDRLAKLLERAATEPSSVDWEVWNKRYRLYRRAIENFIVFSQDYHKNIQNILLTVPTDIYRAQGWELNQNNFPGDALHDFKTFRYISVQYENFSEECVSLIREKAKISI